MKMSNSLNFIFNIIHCSTLSSVGSENGDGYSVGFVYGNGCYFDAVQGRGTGEGEGAGYIERANLGNGSGCGSGSGDGSIFGWCDGSGVAYGLFEPTCSTLVGEDENG
jgi:hypothetical protein